MATFTTAIRNNSGYKCGGFHYYLLLNYGDFLSEKYDRKKYGGIPEKTDDSIYLIMLFVVNLPFC